MSSVTVLLFGLCLLAFGHVEAANILGIFTMYSPSHNIIHMAEVRALADAGHNVTVVTMLPLNDKNPNYHHIYIPLQEDQQKKMKKMFHGMATAKGKIESWSHNFKALDLMNDVQQKVLRQPALQALMDRDSNKFDLVILGYGFNDYMLGIADHFKCPIVVSWVNVPTGPINAMVGNPDAVSYVPVMWLGNKPMGFWKRLANFLLTGVVDGITMFTGRRAADYYNLNFPPEKGYRSLDEMKRNISLVFCSTYFSEGPIRPRAPNFIEVGGIQVKEKPDPLPEDIENFMSSAEHGVIFFSLGSNVKSGDFSPNATSIIFNVLSQRKEKVLWKWEDPNHPGTAPNIMYQQWFAQDDILAHPKTKLFITHGGKGSITEAQYHGVPMLAIPLFGDQPANAEVMQSDGYGLQINVHELTEEIFSTSLDEVLTNATYSEAIKRYSSLYRDRPMTARQTVVYWTEYVLRHHGAPHLQSPRVHLNFIQYNSLDVIAFLLAALGVLLLTLKYVTRLVAYLLCFKLKSNQKSKTE